MKRRGSALIIAMMLIASIGAVAFGIARLIFANSNVATIYENGTVAYYAAESGIEEGFLRYRFNRNEEIPLNQTIDQASINQVFRTNLSTEQVTQGVDTTSSLSPAVGLVDQAYDLHMGYLGTYGNPWYSNDADSSYNGSTETINAADQFDPNFDTGNYSFLRIPKDETRKFDISELNPIGSSIKLYFKFINSTPINWTDTSNACKAMAEVTFDIKDGMENKSYKILTVYNNGKNNCDGKVSGIPGYKLYSADNSLDAGGYSNYTPAGGFIRGTSSTYGYWMDGSFFARVLAEAGDPVKNKYDQVIMSVKPLFYNADVSFLNNTCMIQAAVPVCKGNRKYLVAGPFSYIYSTGYYGGVTKKLTANIDRQSGTLYDLYDYVIFKGN